MRSNQLSYRAITSRLRMEYPRQTGGKYSRSNEPVDMRDDLEGKHFSLPFPGPYAPFSKRCQGSSPAL
jgi:hypothetical protein